MKDWFMSLESREQQFVSIGTFVVAIALLYGLIWVPMERNEKSRREDIATIERAITDLRSLRATAATATAQSSSRTPGSRQSPLIIVDQTLQLRGLDRYRRNSQPTSSNGIRVVFEDVAFDELVVWLGELSEQHALHVQNGLFSAGSQAASGRVNATLTLERAL